VLNFHLCHVIITAGRYFKIKLTKLTSFRQSLHFDTNTYTEDVEINGSKKISSDGESRNGHVGPRTSPLKIQGVQYSVAVIVTLLWRLFILSMSRRFGCVLTEHLGF
jgi:hypothetical protein